MALKAQLSRIYYGKSEGALRGIQALYRQARKEGVQVSRDQVKQFLSSQPTYSLFRPARRNYPRNIIRANVSGEVVQIDIMDMQRYKSHNDGYAYVLLAYDTYSRFLQGVPLKDRKPGGIIQGLETFINGPLGISNIYWDKEGSFLSKRVQDFLKDVNISNYTTKSQVKAPGVERVIRTIRTAVQRFFHANKTTRWLEFLPDFIASYNERKHSSTHVPPNEALNNPMLVLPQIKPRGIPTKEEDLPPIGSYVRLNRLRALFDKEASGTWTEEVFRVVRHKTSSQIPLIYVEDLAGDPVQGGLYPQEYQQIKFDSRERQVERVLETRRRSIRGRRRIQYKVTFKGYPPSVTGWVSAIPPHLR